MRVVVALALFACSGSKPATPVSAAPVDASVVDATPTGDAVPFQIDYGEAERTAWARAKPVFAKYCAKCHTKHVRGATAESLDAFDMTKYPIAGKYTKVVGDVVRDVLGQSGVPAKMPKDKPGTLVGDDLALILAWTDAWARAHHDTAREPH